MYYIIYLLFGKSKNDLKNELCYSLLSLDKITADHHKRNISILIYTDEKPDGLPDLTGKFSLQPEYLDEQYIQQKIQNANGYPYIIKSYILSAFLKKYKSCGLFVDSDTFFTKDPTPLYKTIEQGIPLMHMNEYPITKYPDVQDFLESETFMDVTGVPFKASVHFNMWNSGVIGIGPSHAALIPDVEYLIQQMASSVTFKTEGKRLSEQLAFSYYFEKLTPGIQPAEAYVVHYWFFKEARYLLANHFHRFFGSDESTFHQLLSTRPALLNEINKVSYENIPRLIFQLMRAFNLLDYFHYKALPPDSNIGKLLRCE